MVDTAGQGSDLVRSLFDDMAKALSNGISDLINPIGSDLVVIGGAAEEESQYLLNRIRSRLLEMNGLFSGSSGRVEMTSAARENILKGALLVAVEEVLEGYKLHRYRLLCNCNKEAHLGGC